MILKFRQFVRRIWNSPTITTWASYIGKSVSIFIVTPLILKILSKEEINLWYLFVMYIGFQSLANLGFNSVFIRAIAYAKGGAKEVKIFNNSKVSSIGETNWELIEEIYSNISTVYNYLAFLFVLLLALLGTLSLYNPIALVVNSDLAWGSWIIIVFTTGISLWGEKYVVYLMGVNKIPLIMRWQSAFSFTSAIVSVVVLFFTKSLFWLVFTNQSFLILNVIRNRYLSIFVEEGRFSNFNKFPFNKKLFDNIFPSAWRTWVAQFMSQGVLQLSGIFYAQFSSAGNSASYLFALSILNQLRAFSSAPFYSKIPLFAELFAKNKISKLLLIAKRAMVQTHIVFLAGFLFLGLFGPQLFRMLSSNINFPAPLLWALLGFAFWFERFGALHIQLYAVTNHIKAHIANFVAGVFFLGIGLLFFSELDVYSFAIGLLVGNAFFYSWYCAMQSYRYFQLRFWAFDKYTFVIPFVLLLVYTIFTLSNHVLI